MRSLKSMRIQRGFSIKYIAGKLKISTATYKKKEMHPGEFSIPQLETLSEIYNMDSYNLFIKVK